MLCFFLLNRLALSFSCLGLLGSENTDMCYQCLAITEFFITNSALSSFNLLCRLLFMELSELLGYFPQKPFFCLVGWFSFLFFFEFFVCLFFEARSSCSLSCLECNMKARLALTSERLTSFCLLCVGITSVQHHIWPMIFLIYFFLGLR